MSDEDISKRIKELSRKVAIARRGRNPELLANLQQALLTYQDAIRQRRIESWHENRKKLRIVCKTDTSKNSRLATCEAIKRDQEQQT